MPAAPRLVERLQAILGPLPPGVVRAFEGVDPARFLPAHLAALAGADAPLPFLREGEAVAVTPSPRALALWLQGLEVEDGHRVLLVGAEAGYLAALLRAAGAREVRIVAPDRASALAGQDFLAAAQVQGVDVQAGPPARASGERPWDRIALLDPRRTLGALGKRLAEGGFAMAFAHTAEGWEAVRTFRASPTGDDLAELRAPDLRLPGPGLPEGPGSFVAPERRRTLTGLLELEGMAQRCWTGPGDHPAMGKVEADLRQGVEDTWALPAAAVEAMGTHVAQRRALAQQVFHLGFLYQAAGDLANARDLYARSLAILPTAEGHTFLGWVQAFEGRVEEAIASCHQAIAADPTLGNPYNDIGAYLLQLDRPAEALAWLEKALVAPRYEAPQFALLNLARAHLALGDGAAARGLLRELLAKHPGYAPAQDLLRRLEPGAPPERPER